MKTVDHNESAATNSSQPVWQILDGDLNREPTANSRIEDTLRISQTLVLLKRRGRCTCSVHVTRCDSRRTSDCGRLSGICRVLVAFEPTKIYEGCPKQIASCSLPITIIFGLKLVLYFAHMLQPPRRLMWRIMFVSITMRKTTVFLAQHVLSTPGVRLAHSALVACLAGPCARHPLFTLFRYRRGLQRDARLGCE